MYFIVVPLAFKLVHRYDKCKKSLWQRNFTLACAAGEPSCFDLYCREKKWRPGPDPARNQKQDSRAAKP